MPRLEQPSQPPAKTQNAAHSTDVAEAKRAAARRRFLAGGAAALPVIVTLGHRQAFAASMQVCQSAGLDYGDGFTGRDFGQDVAGRLKASVYCRPENL